MLNKSINKKGIICIGIVVILAIMIAIVVVFAAKANADEQAQGEDALFPAEVERVDAQDLQVLEDRTIKLGTFNVTATDNVEVSKIGVSYNSDLWLNWGDFTALNPSHIILKGRDGSTVYDAVSGSICVVPGGSLMIMEGPTYPVTVHLSNVSLDVVKK